MLQQQNNKYLENIDLLRFPLIVLVVFIHSYHPAMENMGQISLFVWHFIRDVIAAVAVPAFFLISGYLLFYGKTWTWQVYGRQLSSRAFTIVLPYIFWTVFYWTLMFTTGHLPEPTLPQFWFLHELMFLVVISPVFHFLHKKAWLFLALFAAVRLFLDWRLDFYILTSMTPIVFFYAGSVFAVKRIAVFEFANRITGKFRALLLGLSGSAFFVFAFHEPMIKFLFTDMYMRYKPQGDAVLVLYFVSAIVMVYASVSVYRTLKFFVPGFTNFITGGRS